MYLVKGLFTVKKKVGEVQLDPIIKAEKLTFEYESLEEGGEKITALNGVDVSIKKGSFTAVLGRNGSGKSTLAKNLNALYVPSGGCVLVAGMDTADDSLVWEIRKTAGMVFQNPDNQIVAAIVEDDVAFGPENLGIPSDEIRERIDAAMKSVGIYEQRAKSPSALSGGQKQRAAIAGVIAMKPQCIIFDEPTAMLDPKGREDVMNIIKQLHKEGITIVLITHFMEEASAADRVIIMNNGSIAADGMPSEIFSQSEIIQKAGLEAPAAARIAEMLRGRGVNVPQSALTINELAQWLADAGAGAGTVSINENTANNKADAAKVTTPHGDQQTADKSAASESAACGAVSTDYAEAMHASETKGISISVENITHIYNKGRPDETAALDGVSFTVEPGEFVGIIGHTGSGKSTLIQHLNGLLKPDSGRIIPEPDRNIRKKIGLVFQYPEYQLFEETVAKDIAFGPKNLGANSGEIESLVREAMELVGLPYELYAERSPFELSGGQKRRAAIAGVLAMRPEVLILDEPTAGLDPQAHKEILEMIEDIRRRRRCSVVLVSHNMDDVAKLCGKVLVMHNGKLVLQGTPKEVFSHDVMLKEIGLGLPPGGELIYEMKKHGVSAIDDAIDESSAADAVLKYLGR